MAEVPTDSSTSWAISSGSKTTRSAPGGASSRSVDTSGSRTTMPSSLGSTWASTPYRSVSRRPIASAHGAVDLGAEHAVHGQPPVAQLVAEPLDHDRAVVGQVPGGLPLLVHIGQQVVGGPVVQPAVGSVGRPPCRAVLDARRAAGRRWPGPARPGGPSWSPFQNGIRAAAPGRGRDQHPVGGDLLDPPGGRAEQEDVADPRLVDHLLVQLADPGGPLGAGQEDPEQAPVGDGAAAGDGEPLRAGAAGEQVGGPVPDQPGPQLGEGGRRVAAGEHVQHGVAAPSRAARRRARPGGPARPGRRRATAPARPSRRSAGPARRAGCAGSAAPRCAPSASARRPPRRRAGRRGAWGRPRRGRPRRPGARPGRPVAGRRRPAAAPRSAPPGRPRPCRCPAPGEWWPPPRAAGRT